MTASRSDNRLLAGLFAVFALSGFTGLIYESIWSHYLRLMLGHSAYAQTLVLAIFMGGMAGGAWLCSRYLRPHHPALLIYAVIEGLVGLAGIAFHSLYVSGAETLYLTLIPDLDSSLAIETIKWSLAVALILPQSLMLGATFPLLSVGLIRVAPDRRTLHRDRRRRAALSVPRHLGGLATNAVRRAGRVTVPAVGKL